MAKAQSNQTHCKRGHELAGDNLLIERAHTNCPRRKCRACARLSIARNEGKAVWVHYDACAYGHPLSGDNVTPRSIARPIRSHRCIACKRSAGKRYYRSGSIPMETMRRVIDAVNEGWTRNMVTEGKRGNYIVCKRIVVLGKLNAFIKENSKLGKWLTKRLDENGRVVIAAGQAKLRKNVVKSALTTTIMDEIKAALTMWLDPVTERPDITSSIWWAVAEGQLKATDIKARAKEFVTAHRRGYTNTGRFAFNSLDGPVSDDNPTSRIERLTASDAMWVSECP